MSSLSARFFNSFRVFVLLYPFFIGAAPGAAQKSIYPTFKNCWQFASEKATEFAPVAAENKIFVALSDSSVAALDAATGNLLWNAPLGGEIAAAPQTVKALLVVASRVVEDENNESETIVRAVSQSTGVTIWQKKFPNADKISLVVNQNSFFVRLSQKSGGSLFSLNPETGAANWMKTFNTNFASELIASENYLYFVSADSNLQAFRKSDGNLHKQFSIKRPGAVAISKLVVAGGKLIYGDEAGTITVIEESDGNTKWSLRSGGAIQDILPTPQGIVVSSLDNFVYLHNAETGKRRWRRRLVGRPISVSQLSPDALLLLSNGDGNFAVLRLKNGKYLAQNTLGADNYAVAAPFLSTGRLFISTFKGIQAFVEPNITCNVQKSNDNSSAAAAR
jgi:outer membrane protein assembly factor BamB